MAMMTFIKIMTKIILIFYCILLGTTLAPAAESMPIANGLAATFTAACNQAAKEGKGVLLEFFSYNSVESKMLRDNVLASPAVKVLTDKSWILVSSELERDSALRGRFAVAHAPTLILLRSDGTEVDRLVGYAQPDELVRALKAAGEGKSLLDELIANANNPTTSLEAHLALAAAYFKRGQSATALAELTTCLDRATAQGPDRKFLKIILTRLAALGATQPAALDALRTRRDTLEKTPTLPSDSVLVLIAFNDVLKEPNRSVDFYLKLPVESPLRQQLFSAIFLQLVETQHYSEATGTIDLETYINNTYPRTNAVVHDHDSHELSTAMRERMEQQARQRVIDVTGAAVQALLATDRLEKAKRVTGRLLETYDGKDARSGLTQAIQRSAARSANDFSAWLQATYPEKAEAQLPLTAKPHQPVAAGPAK